MAINYLNTVNLNSNQLENAAIQNLATDPAAGVSGQVYYNTTISELKICTTASATAAVWTVVGSYDYWVLDADGQGTTANITNGMTADFVGGLKITTDSTSGGILNIVHDTQAQTDSTSTVAPAYGGTFTTVDSVTRDSTGHVTGINVKTVTIPASDNTNTTYDLTSAANATAGVDIVLTGSDASTDAVNIIGSPSQIEITQTATANKLQIGLPDDVTIGNDLYVVEDVTIDGDLFANDQLTVENDATFGQNIFANGDILASAGFEMANNEDTYVDMGSNRVENVGTPTDSTDAATKAYVDTAVTGLLEYQGGYNASTNTPNLDTDISISGVGSGSGPFAGTVATTGGSGTGMTVYVETNPSGGLVLARVVSGGSGYAVSDVVAPTITNHTQQTVTVDSVPIDNIEKGWTYTITTGGYFYNELVAPGDVIIAEVNAPTEQDAWTKVQNNVDLASEVQVGIGNVVAGTSATITAPYSNGTATLDVVDSSGVQKGAVIVAPGEAIDVSYSSGTATVSVEDSTAANKGAVIVAGGTGITVTYSSGTATVNASSNGKRISLDDSSSNILRTESGGLTTFEIDCGGELGSTSALDVKAEIISAAGQTVYADITRSATDLSVIFTGSVANAAYEALLIDLA
jgi:hypothetical protein